jgi:transmembrane sensor
MSAEYEPTEAMIGQAASWLALLHDDGVTAEDRQAFNNWRQEDPRHFLAVARMQSLWGSFEQLPTAPARRALDQAFTRSPGKSSRRYLQMIALCGSLALAWFSLDQAPVWMADQRTHIGERRVIALADGSHLQLNSDSAVDIEFDERRRVIDLHRGEVWVEVAKDPQRPFVVRTDQGTITALGTRFLVRSGADGAVQVSVLESAIAANANSSVAVRVSAGQQATLKDGLVRTPQSIGNEDPAAWTRGLLKVDDRPLAEVLEALGSYRHGLLQFDATALEGMRVSGVFQLDDTDAALATLADNLPIKVEHFTDLLVWVKPAD